MFQVDLDKFWADDEVSHKENCFFKDAPQVALGIRMHDECVFSELGVEGDPWGIMNKDERIELNKRYNDIAEKTVGIRLLREDYPHQDERYHGVKRIGEVFEGVYKTGNKTGEWLSSNVKTPSELEKLLDRVDKLDLRDFMMPPNWENEKIRIFEYYSPNENDKRFQHSDSAMAHLLPILGKLNLTGCNFGPTVLVDEIRKYMPKTRIDGCMAPFTFMSNDTDKIIAEVKRDCDIIKKTGTKGLNILTAGSINNGSSLESMRAVMYAIQTYGRY